MSTSRWPTLLGLLAAGAVALLVFLLTAAPGGSPASADEKDKPAEKGKQPEEPKDDAPKRTPAPDLDGGTDWLNTGGPLSLKKDLKGKVVLLDFWTLCCINCIHILPDLAKLEKKYADQLVVIGVHSAKFENEKDTKSIRKAVLRYEIAHPVVNDADHKIWDKFNVRSWPTFVLIDPEANLVGETSGEGNYDILDRYIGMEVEKARKKKTLNEGPARFDLARFREKGDTPLFFPGKVLADEAGKRLFIADSTHHRVVVTDLDGNKVAVAGTGAPGKADGPFETARFDDPQGMAVRGDILYVADRKNHAVREINLKEKTVKTIAGTGEQDGDFGLRRAETPVGAKTVGLNSPWDVLLAGDDKLFIAMAGDHQIWLMDLTANTLVPYAGNGREDIGDGPLAVSRLAQPSGLATDGESLYVADSEGSAIRKMPLSGRGRVETLVGKSNAPGALFNFGDKDGTGPLDAKLQHALGVTFQGGKVWIADTYNSKIRTLDPKTLNVVTFLGGDQKDADGGPLFNEPAGISYAAGKLYVADTNAHRVRVVDLATKKVTTLPLKGVEPPPTPKEFVPPVEPKK